MLKIKPCSYAKQNDIHGTDERTARRHRIDTQEVGAGRKPLERITLLENTIFTTKRVFTFQEACMYIGVSESMLYKLTSSKEIPHYKPRGKMVYFAKEELDEWLLQRYEPTVNEAMRMATEAAATEPFLNKRRNGKRKKD